MAETFVFALTSVCYDDPADPGVSVWATFAGALEALLEGTWLDASADGDDPIPPIALVGDDEHKFWVLDDFKVDVWPGRQEARAASADGTSLVQRVPLGR